MAHGGEKGGHEGGHGGEKPKAHGAKSSKGGASKELAGMEPEIAGYSFGTGAALLEGKSMMAGGALGFVAGMVVEIAWSHIWEGGGGGKGGH